MTRQSQEKMIQIIFIAFGFVCLILLLGSGRGLDFIISVSIAFTFFILVRVSFEKEPKAFSSLPTLLFISAMLRILIGLFMCFQMLFSGDDLDLMILNTSRIFPKVWEHSNQIIFVYIITFLIFHLVAFLSITFTTRISNIRSRFIQDRLPQQLMRIDIQCLHELIDDSEANIGREAARENVNIIIKINESSQFLLWEIRIVTVTILMLLVIGVLLASVLRGEPLLVSIQTYLKFAIDLTIIFLSSVMFSLISIVLMMLKGERK